MRKRLISLLLLATLVFAFCGGFCDAAIYGTTTSSAKKIQAENAVGGVKVSWASVSGATKYRVYYKELSQDKYTRYEDTTDLYAVIPDLASGCNYKFAVRPYLKEEKAWGDAVFTGWFKCCAAPEIKKIETTSDATLKVTWSKVDGATKYRVYYRTADAKKYTKYADTAALNCEIEGLSDGEAYYIAVKAYNGKTWSAHIAKKTIPNFVPVKIGYIYKSSSASDITLNLVGTIHGKLCRIYYKQANANSWTLYDELSADEVRNEVSVDSNIFISGVQYVFAIRAFNGYTWSPVSESDIYVQCSYSRGHDFGYSTSSARNTSNAYKETYEKDGITYDVYYLACEHCGALAKDCSSAYSDPTYYAVHRSEVEVAIQRTSK